MESFTRKGFSVRQVIGILLAVFLWAAGSAYAQVTIPNTFSAGTTISSSQVNDNFTALKNAVDPLMVSRYFQFGSLCWLPTDVSSTAYTKLNTTETIHSFTKMRDDTKVEVRVNSRFHAGTFSIGTNGIMFQVRIDDTATTLVENLGSILASAADEFLNIYAVFQNLPAGAHTVSLWAITSLGSSAGVLVDPGCYGGAIIVKEIW